MVPQSVVGEDETGPDSDSAEQDSSNWHLQTPEGQIYGPVPKSELDSWVAEGRAIFNLEPIEAIRHFHHELEPVE